MAGSCSGSITGNLPADLTSFVGRRREIAEVKRLLRRHRLVTLTGGPGMGKTRLALRVAGQPCRAFPDGVWLVELTALDDPRFLDQTVMDALGMPGAAGTAGREALTRFLADKDLLLVLDGCEHLVDACAPLAADLLATAPRLRILATSRHALRIAGEWLLEVPPLPVPREERPLADDAVRLFDERAATALPGFAPGEADREKAREVCRRLDGIPLSIELAAARVRAMPVEAILERLRERSLDALDAGARVSLPRLQTPQATIEWSFALCSAAERCLWTRASVFSGGFDIGAAERVCPGTGTDGGDLLAPIAGLVDKSVLTCSPAGGRTRYRMLGPIREYGSRCLARSGETALVRTRHRDHFAELARQAERGLLTADELAMTERLGHDYPNVRAALEFCLTEPGQAGMGVRLAGRLQHYWTMSVRHREGRYWLDRALSLDPEPSPARAKALCADGWLALLLAEWDTAGSLIEQARNLAACVGHERALAHAALLRDLHELFCGDLRRAVESLTGTLATMRALDDRVGVWMSLRHLTYGTALLGDADRSRDYGEQCLDMAETAGAPLTRARSLGLYGLAQWLVGEHERAAWLVRERLRISPISDRWGIARALEILAWDAAGRSPARAARLLGSADAVLRFTAALPTQRPLAGDHLICERRTRAALGERAFAQHFDEGRRLAIDQAIGYALGDRLPGR